jgi:hypothetical protein
MKLVIAVRRMNTNDVIDMQVKNAHVETSYRYRALAKLASHTPTTMQ